MTVTRWRVAVTRDEESSGPLSTALRDEGFVPQACPVLVEGPPTDSSGLNEAAMHLERFDWVILSSARAVRALMRARGTPWPAGVRTAAVGSRTAAALAEAGATEVFTAPDAGAEALWAALAAADNWAGRDVLLPIVKGGRHELIDGLAAAGAHATMIEAYAMVPRPHADIASSWRAIAPESVVIASPSVGTRLIESVGAAALQNLCAVVAMGTTTARALEELGVRASVPPTADFPAIAGHLARLWSLRDVV